MYGMYTTLHHFCRLSGGYCTIFFICPGLIHHFQSLPGVVHDFFRFSGGYCKINPSEGVEASARSAELVPSAITMLLRTTSALRRHSFRRLLCSWTVDMPRWGVPVAEGAVGTVGELLCDVGAHVETDEAIAVVETDKVTVDIRASRPGVVTAVLATAGAEVLEGQPLYRFEPIAEAADDWETSRRWAFEHERRRARQEEDARLHWETWQRRWQSEQKRRWEEWERRRHQEPWWRQHQQQQRRQHHEQRHDQQGQRQRHQQQQRQPRFPEPSAAWASLPDGAIRRILLAKTHYEALGLPKNASATDIRAAFRRLALVVHPDKHHGEAAGSVLAAASQEAFVRITQAHHTLSDATRRRAHDRMGW